jgi:hypothetical protein
MIGFLNVNDQSPGHKFESGNDFDRIHILGDWFGV